MNSRSPKQAEPSLIRIDGSLLEPRAAEIVQELRELLGDYAQIRCDLSLVDAIDLMGVQLLFAARASQQAKGGTLRFESPSEPIREVCASLGVNLEND